MAERKWEYIIRQSDLPPGANSPMPSSLDIEWWLNKMDAEGWEYVGPALRQWNVPDVLLTWFVFRRQVTSSDNGGSK